MAAAKPKTISILPATKLQVKNAPPDALATPFLKAGARIIVIGKDAGTGKDVPARLVLVIPSVTSSTPAVGNVEEPVKTEPGEPVVKTGEKRYEGKITGVLSPTVFTVSVTLEINDKGETTELGVTQKKTVEMSADTDLYSRADATRKLKFEDVKVGQRVTLVGKSTGRIVKAREVAIWEDDSAKTRYHSSVSVSQEVAALAKKGDAASDARLYDEALKFFSQALTSAQGNNDSNGQGMMQERLGLTYRQLKQPKRAMENYQSALVIWKRIGNENFQGSNLLNISRIHTEANDSKQARVTIDEAIQALEGGGATSLLAIAYGHLGQLQADEDKVAEGLVSWEKALAISRQLKERDDESDWLGQIAIAQAEFGQTANATKTIEELLALIPQTEDKSNQAWSYYSIGIAYRSVDQNEKAIENMKLAEAIFTQAGQREDATNAKGMIEFWLKPKPLPVPKKVIKPEPGAALPA